MIDVVAGVIENDGKILIARKSPDRPLAGMWEFPGGKIDPGESPEEALTRELLEEFSISTTIGEFIASSEWRYQNAEIRLLAYWVSYRGGEFSLLDHDQIEWEYPQEIDPEILAPADRPILEKVIQLKLN